MPDLATAVLPGPRGVRGWLLFLVVNLCIIGPLFTIVALPAQVSEGLEAQSLYPWYGFLLLTSTTCAAFLMVFSLYAGISLWRCQPGAVRTASLCLICFAAFGFFQLWLPFLAQLPPESRSYLVKTSAPGNFRTIVSAGVWYWYLQVSQRVRNTFPLHSAAA